MPRLILTASLVAALAASALGQDPQPQPQPQPPRTGGLELAYHFDRLAGKTGTSQVRNITAAERAKGVFRNEDLPWNRRDHALFVGFAPYDAPRIAVSVVVEHGGGGSTVAAPIARDIVLATLSGGMPPLEAYPASQRRQIESEQDRLPLGDGNADDRGWSRA